MKILSTFKSKAQEILKISFRNNSNSNVRVPLFSSVCDKIFHDKIAFTDHQGQNFTYKVLGSRALSLSEELKKIDNNNHGRVAYLCPHDFSHPVALWGSWMANMTGVPLSSKHPENLLEYYVKTADAKVIVTTKNYADRLLNISKNTNTELLVIDFESLKSDLVVEEVQDFNAENALILYTSGTTGNPKGVLLTHKNLEDQVTNICQAWDISSNDTMLHVLPLHHTHGLIHALISPLATNARCHMLEKFDAARAWKEILSSEELRPSVLMGVPTVYSKLIEEFDKSFSNSRSKTEFVRASCQQNMRVFISGSASLPVPDFEKFQAITGHSIVERMGMTEIGMALTNPLHGTRRPGFVGKPFQSVQIQVVDMISRTNYKVLAKSNWKKTEILEGDKNGKVSGDMLVKGPSVFKEYWKNSEVTKKEFTDDGWFITGDQVEIDNGDFRILGRKSVDIIKSGGYKLSALEIETQLLGLKEVKEIAVLGLPDPTWGQKVAALIVWNGPEVGLKEFKEIAKSRLPAYACPTVIKSIQEMPRNHLGKVNKKELVKLFN